MPNNNRFYYRTRCKKWYYTI